MRENSKKIYLTKQGFDKLKREYDYLIKLRRPEVIKRMAQARESAQMTENTEYDLAREEQTFVEGRIAELGEILKMAEVIKPKVGGKNVTLGSTVVVEVDGERDEFTLVSSIEADPSKGLISSESIVGKALLGAKVGDVIKVASAVETTYKILEIK